MNRSDFSRKIVSVRTLVQKLNTLRQQKKKIVFTNGCFDVLHVGHVTYLAQAAKLGDVLVVGMNKDASIRRLKGKSRPVCNEKDRALVLSALQSVDFVCLFGEDTPEKLIHAVKPDFLVKGGDWKKHQIVGSAFVESYGGKVRSLPFVDGFSTTSLIEKIQKL